MQLVKIIKNLYDILWHVDVEQDAFNTKPNANYNKLQHNNKVNSYWSISVIWSIRPKNVII